MVRLEPLSSIQLNVEALPMEQIQREEVQLLPREETSWGSRVGCFGQLMRRGSARKILVIPQSFLQTG